MQAQNSKPTSVSSPTEPSSETPALRRSKLDIWLESHLNLLALVVVAIGFLIRAGIAAARFLNPDEVLHFQFANQPSAILAYKASLTNAHPPFFFLLLYFWRSLSSSEFILRLPSVMGGIAFLWLAFQWLKKTFDRVTALIGLMILAFSPAMVALSTEVRSYALLLFFMAGALYFLERAVAEKSARMMLLFSLFLYLALLTHYSALLFTLALGVYALVRIWGRELPGKVARVWIGFQVGAAALCAFLYVTHISKLKGSALAQDATQGWLRSSYFRASDNNLLGFALERSVQVFGYMFGEPIVGGAMFLLFLLGVALLLGGTPPSPQGKPLSRSLVLLLLLPFVFGCGAAVAGLFPYGGTRHTVFLALFAAAGISFFLAQAVRRKLFWASLLAAILALAVFNLYAEPPEQLTRLAGLHEQIIRAEGQNPKWMRDAMQHIRQTVPPGSLIFVDYQTSLLTYYYMDRGASPVANRSHPGFLEFSYGGYRVVSIDGWMFTARRFAPQFEQMTKAYGLTHGDRVPVVQAGWGADLSIELPRDYPKFRCLAPKHFGQNISVFEVLVGPESLPVPPTSDCQAARDLMTNPGL